MISGDRSSRSRTKTWAWLSVAIIGLGVGAVVLVFSSRFGVDPRLVDSPLIGESVPAIQLDLLGEDGALNLAELRGDVIVVNFWASWCFPCRDEHAALTAAEANYGDRGVQLVGIVHQDDPDSAMDFLDRLGWGGANYRYVVDPDSRAAVEFGVFGVPETYFVDAGGRIVGKIQGPVTYSALAGALDEILAGRPPSL